jgi:hypothetical protein
MKTSNTKLGFQKFIRNNLEKGHPGLAANSELAGRVALYYSTKGMTHQTLESLSFHTEKTCVHWMYNPR